MDINNNSNLDELQIADFMKEEGYYLDLRNVKLSKEKIPEQKTKINWKKIKEKVEKIAIIAGVAVVIAVGVKHVKERVEREAEAYRRSQPQEVIHIDTSTPTPKPTSFEDIYIEQQQKELEKAQNDIEKNYFEDDELMSRVSTPELYNAPKISTKSEEISASANRGAKSQNAGITISTSDYGNSIIQPCVNYSTCQKYLTNELESKFKSAADTYGSDPNLLIALAMQETTLGKDLSNPHAIGIMQIEKVLINEIIKAYNYKTGEFESKKIVSDNISSTNGSINMGAAIFQKRSSKYDNYLFAIQSYNYGPEAMEVVLKLAEKGTNKSREDLTFDEVYPYIEYVHYHPQEALSPNWQYKTYGDKDYAKKVVGYLKNNITYNKVTLDGETISLYIYDAATGSKIKSYIQDGNLYVDPATNQRYTKEPL